MFAPSGAARADGKTTKVTIETDPPGAKVYFNLKEDGEKCKTPCTIEAPIGETPIIIEAENRRAIIENLVVRKKAGKPAKFTFKLEPAIGTLIVEGGAGTVKIDDEAKGQAPGRIENVLAGAHHVVVEQAGKPLFDQFVEIEDGQEATVTAGGAAAAPPSAGGDETPGVLSASATPAARARTTPAVAVAAVMDIGFRQFSYSGNHTPDTQRDSKVLGQVLGGPLVELWPTALAGVDLLPGLALSGRFELGLNGQSVAIVSDDGMRTASMLTTKWRSIEVSGNYRWTIADVATVQIGTGYVSDRYQYTGSGPDLTHVPDAAYKSIRIGGRASLLLGMLEPYLVAENRIVLDGGVMADRYKLGTSTSGLHGALGAAIHLNAHFVARLEGALSHYSWTFKAEPGASYQATGGTDSIENVTIALGYLY